MDAWMYGCIFLCWLLAAVATVAAATEEGLAEEDTIRVLETNDRAQKTKIGALETKIGAGLVA